jgi:hypothetical protein
VGEADGCEVEESSKQWVEPRRVYLSLPKNISSATTQASCCHSPLGVVDKKQGLRPRHPATRTCC